eukprot:6728752-Alexandrium_andersonii.AAC.1
MGGAEYSSLSAAVVTEFGRVRVAERKVTNEVAAEIRQKDDKAAVDAAPSGGGGAYVWTMCKSNRRRSKSQKKKGRRAPVAKIGAGEVDARYN